MSTTDRMNTAQRPLAEYAWKLKKKYKCTNGLTQKQFMALYDNGEIQLSGVYENLFVTARNLFGLPTKKVSGDGYDFVTVVKNKDIPLGDMKTSVLCKDGDKRRFVISNVKNKQGIIYAIGWNWLTNKPNFFAVPPNERNEHPAAGIKIPVKPNTGERAKGWYNKNCAYDTWEDLCQVS
jgi:hypothetical protein